MSINTCNKMKIRTIFIAAAAILAVSCTGKPAATTTIIGQFGSKLPDEVHLVLPGQLDTVIATDPQTHSFKAVVPTDVLSMLNIESEDHGASLIPDGTTLTVNFGDEYQVDISSNKPKISVQKKFDDFGAWIKDFMNKFNEERAAARNDSTLTSEEREAKAGEIYDAAAAELNDKCREIIKANPDNLLSIVALQNMDVDDDEMLSIINGLSDKVKELPDVMMLTEVLSVRGETAEGKKFKDFTVVQDPENPETSTVKFSDFIGKGKYILVDFWASWCGPCKAEMPNLKDVYEKFHGDNFDMLSVAVWDNPEASVETAEELGIQWNQIINAQKVPTELYGIEGIPHIILFGPDGTILKRNLRGAEIGRAVAEALSK